MKIMISLMMLSLSLALFGCGQQEQLFGGQTLGLSSSGGSPSAGTGGGSHSDDGQDDGKDPHPGSGVYPPSANLLICHRPPGGPPNWMEIQVGSEAAVQAHLAHGDRRGHCPSSTPVCP